MSRSRMQSGNNLAQLSRIASWLRAMRGQPLRLGKAKLARNNAAALTTMDGPAGVS